MNKVNEESRTFEKLKDHYEIEKELANRLRNAPKQERRKLYTSLYDELFNRVSLHPQLIKKDSFDFDSNHIKDSIGLLKHFLSDRSVYLEIGAGDCALALGISKFVRKVYAVDVSREITKNLQYDKNFELLISDGCSIPVPESTVDVAYSNQLMEHLHPEDALEQLHNIYRALVPGGKYICITPNRIFGPHDISKYFDKVATGFHLKEYTIAELADSFKKAGFSNIKRFIHYKGLTLVLPVFPAKLIENSLLALPQNLDRTISNLFPVKFLLGGCNVKIVATK